MRKKLFLHFFKEWFPFLTLVLTIITLIFSIIESRRNEAHFQEMTKRLITHDKLSLKPIVELRAQYLYDSVRIFLKNVGVGPATILNIDFYYDGKHFNGTSEFWMFLFQIGLIKDHDSTRYGASESIEDSLSLGKDENWPLLLFDHAPFDLQLKIHQLFRITGIKITYLDAYDDTLQRWYNRPLIE